MGGIVNGIPKSIDGVAKDVGATLATITNIIRDLRHDASGTLIRVSNECIESLRIITQRADQTSFLLTNAALAIAATIPLSILLYLSHFSPFLRAVVWTMYACLCLHMLMTYIRHSRSRPSRTYEQQQQQNERISCRYGHDCRDKNDLQHRSKYSHPLERILCRYGRDCRDQNDDRHCSKYSHPHKRMPCRYGRDCRDKNDAHHCSKYSHPDESKSKSLPDISRERILCRYGSGCRDKKDPQHRSKYSHPKE